jgi:N-acetylneuraminic acid mutarotase
MPTDRKGMSAAVLDNKIWVIGGKQMWQNALNVVEVYDPSTDSWNTQISNISHARENATAEEWNGKIYLFGGRNNHNLISEVEVYDPGIGSWQTITTIPTPRFGVASVIVDSSIWLIGGTNMNYTNYNIIEIYNPTSNSWTTLPANLNISRGNPMASVIDSSVYVFGGDYFGPVISYEKYDFSTQTWLNAGNMQYSCGSAGYLTFSNQAWLIGGMGQGGTLGTVQKFFMNGGNPNWVQEASLNTARRELVAAMVNNKIYAIGGRGMMGGQTYDSVEELDVVVGILQQQPVIPENFVTISNYPNPFNNVTIISVQIPENDVVSLKVYDIRGSLVGQIYNGNIQAGTHKFYFDAINSSGLTLPSGVYFIHYDGNKFSKFKKINLIK